VDTGSRPSADRTEIERLLHQLRSTLARLKAELEIAQGGDESLAAAPMATVDEALTQLDCIARVTVRRAQPLRRTVLVVDDDLRLATAMARQLQRLGVEAIAQANLGSLETLNPDNTTVLIDLGVLRISSRESLAKLAQYRITVMSGSADPPARLEARSYGASTYLVKPVDPILVVPQGG
jgi:CheY-like chemotaxis protein